MAEGLTECIRCWGTGWRDCEVPWCSEQEWHGGYCSCPAGIAREEDESHGSDTGRTDRGHP